MDPKRLFDFLAASPSCYHVVSNLAARLTAEGYTPLSERDRWTLTPGGRYFVTRNSSRILAFRVPRKLTGGFMMAAAHSDSPAFKLKENAELRDNGYRVRAQVDVLMPGAKTAISKSAPNDGSLLATLGKPDGITLGELQRTAKNVLRMTLRTKFAGQYKD